MMLQFYLIGGALLLNIFIFLVVYANRYTKAGPNEVLVISGLKRQIRDSSGRPQVAGFRIVKGGGTFVWPVLEQCQTLSLEVRRVPVRLSNLVAKDGVIDGLEAMALCKVGGDDISILHASEALLSKTPEEVRAILEPIVIGALRDLAAHRTRAELSDAGYLHEVSLALSASLAPLGMQVVSVTLTPLP